MKWENRERSSNVKRGQPINNRSSSNRYNTGPSYRRGGGGYRRGPIFIPMGGGRRRGGLGSIIFLFILFFIMRGLFSVGSDVGYNDNVTHNNNTEVVTEAPAGSRARLEDFMAVVLKDTEDVWHEKFAEQGATYNEPDLILFQGNTRSACGVANSNMGPFYCPIDQSIYVDVDFYNELTNRFGGGGDFAFAYVLAHEVGHHVQNELGILGQTNKLRQTLSKKEYNKISVAQELQADYFAGLFAYYVEEKDYLDPGDIEEAMNAAAAIGDDRIQEMSGRSVNVDNFTHGSSEQRQEAFELGYKYHDIDHSMVFFDRLDY